MRVNTGTTFSQIETKFGTGEHHVLGDKHVRMQGTELYASGAFHVKGKDAQARTNKKQDAATAVASAIDYEFGPGTADRVFAKINADHGVNFKQAGIHRKDFGTIRAAINDDAGFRQSVADFKKSLPQGIAVNGQQITGTVTLTKSAIPPDCKTFTTFESNINKFAKEQLENLTPITLSDGRDIEMPTNSVGTNESDMKRMHFHMGGFDTKLKTNVQIADQLVKFADNDPDAAKVLASLCNQHCLRPLQQGMQTSAGQWTTFTFPSRGHEGGFNFTGANGATQNVGNPGQYGEANIRLSKDHNMNYVIDIDWPMYATGFRGYDENGVNGDKRMPLGNDTVFKGTLQTQITVSSTDAAEGKLRFVMTQPTMTFEGQVLP